jgi:hypothetical protein
MPRVAILMLSEVDMSDVNRAGETMGASYFQVHGDTLISPAIFHKRNCAGDEMR